MASGETGLLEREDERVGTQPSVAPTNFKSPTEAEWADLICESPEDWNLAIQISNSEWGETWGKCSC
jgi:hypothetical protein